MPDRPAPEFEVVVRPAFGVTMAGLVAVYALFHLTVTRLSAGPATLPESLAWGGAVTALILLGTIAHEFGHVLAGLLSGHRWTAAVLNGAGLGVVIEPRPHGWQRVYRSLAGPVVQLLFALALLVVAAAADPAGRFALHAAETSIWWVGGISTLFLAVLNLLPIPGCDGAKVVVGVRELLRPTPA